jgi:SlyX protein
MSDERLTDLEIRIAYQEDTLRSLDTTVARQQADIERLERMNRELYQRLREVSELMEAGSKAPAHEKPPHY